MLIVTSRFLKSAADSVKKLDAVCYYVVFSVFGRFNYLIKKIIIIVIVVTVGKNYILAV